MKIDLKEFNVQKPITTPLSISPYRFWIHIPFEIERDNNVIAYLEEQLPRYFTSRYIEIRKYKNGYDINTCTFEDYQKVFNVINKIFDSKELESFLNFNKLKTISLFGFAEYSKGQYFLQHSREYIFFNNEKPKLKLKQVKTKEEMINDFPETDSDIIKSGFFVGRNIDEVYKELLNSYIDVFSGKWDKLRSNNDSKSKISTREKSKFDLLKMLMNAFTNAPNNEWRKKINYLIETINIDSIQRRKYLIDELKALNEL